MDVVADKRLRQRVLRPQRRSPADRATSIGQGSYRLRKILEIRVARKELVPFREAMVDAHVKLVLIVGLIAEPSEIVRKSRGSWLRITVKQRCGGRIERVSGNQISRVGMMVRRTKDHALAHLDCVPGSIRRGDRRIPAGRRGYCAGWRTVQRYTQERREVAQSFSGGGNCGSNDATDLLPRALIIDKEECLVVNDRTAEHKSKLISAELRFVRVCGRCGSEEVAGIQGLVPQKLEYGSVEIIAAGLRRQIDDASIKPAEGGRGIIGLHVKLANGINDRKEGHLPGLRLQDTYAVVKIFVRAWAAPAQSRQCGPGRQCDSGSQSNKIDEGAAVQWQRGDRTGVDNLTQSCRLCTQERCVFSHNDPRRDSPYGEPDIHTESFTRSNCE